MLFGVGVSQEFHILLFFFCFFIYVSCRDQLLQLGKRKSYLFLLLFTCKYHVVSVRRIFFFLLVLGMGCVILFKHSFGFHIIIQLKKQVSGQAGLLFFQN